MKTAHDTSLTDPKPEGLSNAERDRMTVELLVEATTGDDFSRRSARDRAVELNLPLARYLAGTYAGRGIPIEDLQQVASLGLLKAARGFSVERSTSFAAYAIPTIRGELRKHFRDAGWTVRPPRRIQELQARIRAAEAELIQQLQRSPSVRELADELEVEIDEVLEATSVDSCFTPYSLDAPVPVDNGSSSSVQADLGSWDPEFASAEARLMLAPAIRGLGERDRTVLQLRFVEGLTQQQIGEQVGVSQMQVSRILNRVLAQLRDSIVGEAA
ncbi:MAG: SigB/SigF/SigG family RNA polymerase sigma factor [Marmoricola sp.]